MSRLVWLASFPKSGNTWVRAFVTAYQRADDKPFDLNDLDQSLHAASRILFDRITGLYASDLLPHEVDRLRPDVYRCLAAESSAPQFVKVHDRWRHDDHGQPLFPADASRCALLIVRNPLAVVASYANHYGLSLDASIDHLANDELVISRSETGLRTQLHQPVGSWSSHTRSWLDQTVIPVHVVRYEDLRSEPNVTFFRLLEAAGITADPVRVTRAEASTRFERLREAEESVGFRERIHSAARFFRRGQADSWREELTPAQCRRVIDRHGEVMQRLGYDCSHAE